LSSATAGSKGVPPSPAVVDEVVDAKAHAAVVEHFEIIEPEAQIEVVALLSKAPILLMGPTGAGKS
jgi:ATP-dependent protease Clp ATPase subunit